METLATLLARKARLTPYLGPETVKTATVFQNVAILRKRARLYLYEPEHSEDPSNESVSSNSQDEERLGNRDW